MSEQQIIIVPVEIYATYDIRSEDISVSFTTPQGGVLIKQAGPVEVDKADK